MHFFNTLVWSTFLHIEGLYLIAPIKHFTEIRFNGQLFIKIIKLKSQMLVTIDMILRSMDCFFLNMISNSLPWKSDFPDMGGKVWIERPRYLTLLNFHKKISNCRTKDSLGPIMLTKIFPLLGMIGPNMFYKAQSSRYHALGLIPWTELVIWR